MMSAHTTDEAPPAPRLAFTLILRLANGANAPQGWSSWSNAGEVLGEPAMTAAETRPPYKRYPLDGHAYFAEHVGKALFPPLDAQHGGRWLKHPRGLELRLFATDVTTHTLSIDLLEMVKFELPPHLSFGLVHLTFAGTASTQEMLDCAAILHTRYREPSTIEVPRIELAVAGKAGGEPLVGREPLVALARKVFGTAHVGLSRGAWICAIGAPPADVEGEHIAGWRRALARGFTLDRAMHAIARDPERNERQTERLGPFTALVLGRSAAFTTNGPPPAPLYNVRSYWAETLLLAIVQHDYLEGFAVELGELGHDPLGRPVDELYVNWLAFRNVLGWSYLSTSSDVPQRLLKLAHSGLGTEPLREELEHAFATYIAQRQRRSDDAQEASLTALQIYGAVFAAVGTVAATMQVIGDGLFDCWPARLAVLAALVALGAVVYVVMRRRVRAR
jgi:hypothetical protein